MVPAGERLHGDDLPARHVDDRLQVSTDLAALDAELELVGQATALVGRPPALGHGPPGSAAPVGLGVVHGHVGIGQQPGDGRPGLGDGHTDAGADVDRSGVEREGQRQRTLDGADHDRRSRHVANTPCHHDELVAADAGHEIARADAVSQSTAHGAKDWSPAS